jgi:hypothetical protein
MTKFLLIIFSICSFFQIQNSFAAEKEYEYWGDEYFEDTLNAEYPDSLFNNSFETSKGFFPKPLTNWQFNLITNTEGYNYNAGSAKIDDEFTFLKHIFDSQLPTNQDDFEDWTEEKEPFSDEDKYGFFQSKSSENYDNIGISFEVSVPFCHTIFVTSFGYSRTPIQLYSPNYKKSFLGYNGEKRTFEECSVLEIVDKSLFASIEFRHPIYGGFIKNVASRQFIFYYLTYGFGYNFSLDDKFSAYNYILNPNGELRYSNGEIKETIFSNRNYDKIEKSRYNYSFGIGFQMTVYELSATFELKYRGSLTPFFTNQTFKQNSLQFSMAADLRIFKAIAELFF